MVAKTLHVYRLPNGWAVKREGRPAQTFATKKDAVEAAVRQAKSKATGQMVVHGRDGRLLEYRTYGMPVVQDHPKTGTLRANRISKAVGKVVLERVMADHVLPSADTSAE